MEKTGVQLFSCQSTECVASSRRRAPPPTLVAPRTGQRGTMASSVAMNLPRVPATAPAEVSRAASPRATTRRRVLAVSMSTLLAMLSVTACGVRLESPAPAALVVDADEISRQAMVADVVAVRTAAVEVRSSLPDDDPVASTLDVILLYAEQHLSALGGEYQGGAASDADGQADGELPADAHTPLEPGTVTDEDGDVDPAVTATPAPEVTAGPTTAATVVGLLSQSSGRARGSLATPLDGGRARLYASIAASQLECARDLAAVTGTELVVPDAFTSDEPAVLPVGVSADELATLVRSEDSAGYASEVVAAWSGDDLRSLALDRARTHRERAEVWATLAGVDGTSKDPRRVAYQLPGTAVSTPEAAATLARGAETTLTTSYATLVGQVDADSRAPMLDLLVDSYRAARAWGAPVVAFPGLPEQTAQG